MKRTQLINDGKIIDISPNIETPLLKMLYEKGGIMASGCNFTDKELMESMRLKLKDVEWDYVKVVKLYKKKVTADEWDKIKGKLKTGDPTTDD